MENKEQKFPFTFQYILVALFTILMFRSCLNGMDLSKIKYSEFKKHLHHGDVASVTLIGDRILGEYKTPQGGKKKFETVQVNPATAKEFERRGVAYEAVTEPTMLSNVLFLIVPTILFFSFWFFIMKRGIKKLGGGGSFMSIGKSKAKIYVEKDTKVTFKDIAGADEALEELREVIEFLKNSEKIKRLGGKMPKGVLLVGAPGTGKTLIAKAVAGEAGVPFFSTNGAEFVEMFVGVGAARVRDLFEQAKTSAPCIIFIDELDALGKVRQVSAVSGNDEKEQTLNQLLVEMDGFDSQNGIIILAATNRPEIIDPALLRAGRFDRQVVVDRPDKKGRAAILEIHIRGVKLAPDVKLEDVAGLTPGFSGADLANLVNEAALIATRGDAESIHMAHFTSALERMVTGLEKRNRLLNQFERKVVAHHEIGHALVGHAFNKGDAIHKVSIIPRGIGAMGYTIQRPTEDRFLMTREELENKMSAMMAGRAAESLIFSHLSTGASDDLVRATNIAREMITQYGMSQELGFVSYESPPSTFLDVKHFGQAPTYSDETAKEIDDTLKRLVMTAYHRAYNFLKEHRHVLEEAAQALLAQETLNEQQLMEYFAKLDEPPVEKMPPNLSLVKNEPSPLSH